MERFDLIVVGAGPAGLSAAIEGAKKGMRVVVFDENDRPGGQLFKQIHKFFGSKEHKAKIRGFRIGQQLLKEAADAGVKVVLGATVEGLYLDKEVTVKIGENSSIIKETLFSWPPAPRKIWSPSPAGRSRVSSAPEPRRR